MKSKNKVVLLLSFCMCLAFTAANASPRNVNSVIKKDTQIDVTRLLAQAESTEVVYKRLLEISKQQAEAKKLLAATHSKPQLIKASYKHRVKAPAAKFNKSLKVTATAYTSHVNQTDSTPNIAAWGDRLKPGMKVIAVSRDLLNVYGLKHKQKVRIKGLEGEYVVLDKMNKRWRKKIDIYMGMDIKKAFRWGRRKVEIYWDS